jgi:hypothetical protein
VARRAPDPSARIALLKAARKSLVASKIKGPVNADEMAKIAGLTWRALKVQVEADPEWPCLMRGSEGVAYQFDPKAVLDHMVRRHEEKLKHRTSRNRDIARLAGISPDLADTGMTLDELRVLDQLQVSTQKRKIEQGAYVPLADYEAVIADMLTTIQSEILSTVGRLDPSGKWPAQIRHQVREEGRSLLVRLHDKLAAMLNPDASTARRNRRGARTARP